MKRIKQFVFPAVLAVGLAVFALMGRAPATGADYESDAPPEVIAATFSSAWCASCKVLKPKLAAVIPDFADKPVKFLDLNFTFGDNGGQAKKAADNNFSALYDRFKGATGFTLLIDADTGELIDILTRDHSKAAMRAAIARSLAVAEHKGHAASAAP